MPDRQPPGPEGKHHRIAGYEVLAKIGEGGMGVVFKARQISLDRIVALKVLPPKLTADARFVERFLREARATAKLSHPNIVRIYEVDRSKGGIHYYAMEYVDGESLGSLLKRRRRLGVGEACRIVVQIARALDHAHAQGFVHRDVKPDNVLLDRQGAAKLADLGLARSLEGAATGTQTLDAVVGTPYYMSPEQAEGKTVDARSDLYALGATFYHLLAGSPPFSGETAISVITKHLTEPRPDVRRARPEVPEEVARVIGRLMKIDPRERYPDAKALLADLAPWAEEGAPPRPSPPSPSRSKSRWPVMAASAIALILLGGIAIVQTQAKARREGAARRILEEAEKERRSFSSQASFAARIDALRRCADLARSVEAQYPGTRAAGEAKGLEEEVKGVLAALYREEVAASEPRIAKLLERRPVEPEGFRALRAEVDALDEIVRQPDAPADVRSRAEASVRAARGGIAERLADKVTVAALRGMMLRRLEPGKVREALAELRDFVPEGSPARLNLETEIRLFDLRHKEKKK